MFSELVRLKALLSVTLELFNSQRQSKGLATHPRVSWLKKRSQLRLRPVRTACWVSPSSLMPW